MRTIIALCILLVSNNCWARELPLDTVVASVNNHPITLTEVGQRLIPPQKLTLKDASIDPAARAALDTMILELLIEEEAKLRRLDVSSEDIESYVNEVAKRNGMDRAKFEAALAKDGINMAAYKRRVRIDILRSKISAALVREGTYVTQDEVDNHIEGDTALRRSGKKVKLSQIVINFGEEGASHSQSEATELMAEIQDKLKAGADFDDLVRQYSEGPEANEGGSLGILSAEDMAQTIADAVLLLEPGQTSQVVAGGQSLHIFRLDEKFDEESDTERLKAEVKDSLSKQKLQVKLENYFSIDLPKKHVVDRKI